MRQAGGNSPSCREIYRRSKTLVATFDIFGTNGKLG
jgi:hypothetical protein